MSAVYHNSFFAMGTRCQVVFPGMETERTEQITLSVRLEISRIEAKLSRFRPDSEISKLNASAAKEPVTVSEDVFDILTTCQAFHQSTLGAFDITMRPNADFESLGMSHVHLNAADRTVTFDNEHILLDLGGFGKGYALQQVQKRLQDAGVTDGFISFGESSILTLGRHPAGPYWKVGLNDHTHPGRSAYEFAVNDGSVSTSSNFYVDDAGILRNHRHVIDPKTGQPIGAPMTVSVKSASALDAEILSTAFLVLSAEEAALIRPRFADCDIVNINYASGKPNIQTL